MRKQIGKRTRHKWRLPYQAAATQILVKPAPAYRNDPSSPEFHDNGDKIVKEQRLRGHFARTGSHTLG
jgi:hypothetical protein